MIQTIIFNNYKYTYLYNYNTSGDFSIPDFQLIQVEEIEEGASN